MNGKLFNCSKNLIPLHLKHEILLGLHTLDCECLPWSLLNINDDLEAFFLWLLPIVKASLLALATAADHSYFLCLFSFVLRG